MGERQLKSMLTQICALQSEVKDTKSELKDTKKLLQEALRRIGIVEKQCQDQPSKSIAIVKKKAKMPRKDTDSDLDVIEQVPDVTSTHNLENILERAFKTAFNSSQQLSQNTSGMSLSLPASQLQAIQPMQVVPQLPSGGFHQMGSQMFQPSFMQMSTPQAIPNFLFKLG